MHVLVADDDPIARGIARKHLTGAGAHVQLAETGLQAVEILTGGTATACDVVLMDIEMPVMDGLEAARRIRCEPRYARLPIIALTAHAMVVECRHCLVAGMDDHLIKPYSAAELIEVVTHWGREPDPESSRGASAVLDTDGALARLGGNREFYLRIAGRFAERYAGLDIAAIAARRGHAAAQMSMHSLNGFAGMLGADRLQDLAARLEDALGSDDPQTAALIPSFSAELAAVLDRVRSRLTGGEAAGR